MNNIFRAVFFLCLLSFSTGMAQTRYTLSGTIADGQSNETLIGYTISIPEAKINTTTNQYGFYSVSVPEGTYTFELSYMCYVNYSEQIIVTGNTRKNVAMSVSNVELEVVEITGNSNIVNVRKLEMSVNRLSVSEIKKMPVVLGEGDVLKSILQLPGVTNAGEGTSGFNVRGGAADQNLILLDEATLYSSSHLFGFFSVFNSDAIKDLKLYKGGIPARYGGRVSSVLDIYQ